MKTPRKFLHTKEWLINNYINTDNSIADIAKETSCSYSTVRKWLLRYGITPKPKYRKALSNLILYQKGNIPWNQGLTINDSRVKKAIDNSVRSRINNKSTQGENHYKWKGDKVKYKPLHKWINYHKGKAKICVQCGSSKNVEWANISGKYLRDLTDYKSLCKSCHSKYDIRKKGVNHIL